MSIIDLQKNYREAGRTNDLTARLSFLHRLRQAFDNERENLIAALHEDIGKSRYESLMTEILPVVEEFRYFHKNLRKLMRPTHPKPDLMSFPGQKEILRKPHGSCLIYAPWNYPVQLSLIPCIGALAAGNSIVLKTSSKVPGVNAVLRRLLAHLPDEVLFFAADYSHETVSSWACDMIFFTGSHSVGQKMARYAAEKDIPIVLELGGKSPVLVLDDADIRQAAQKILWGKSLNSGQTCVAPDYILADQRIFNTLFEALIEEKKQLPPLSERAQIITEEKFRALFAHYPPALSGPPFVDEKNRRLDIYVKSDLTPAHPLMQDEIFGPILPILPFHDLEEAVDFIKTRPSPLALYLFTQNRLQSDHLLSRLPFGGASVNDTIMHLAGAGLPFGGVGASGRGRYHQKASWETFTVPCAVYTRRFWDLPMRFAPFTEKKEKILRFLSQRH